MMSIAKVTEIGPRIIRILGCNPGPMTLQGTNTYLVGTGARRVLLDVGEASNGEYLASLMGVLKQHNTSIDKIIISHWHHDHIGGLEDVLGFLPGRPSVYKFPRGDAPDVPGPESVDIKQLKHHDCIQTEGATLRVHHTPGHTTDHVVVELEEEDAVFSGDCILGEGSAVFEDLYTYMASLKLILDLKPNVIYPGHGPVIDNPQERIRYYISHRNQRESQIMDVLSSTPTKFLSAMELVKIIYKETPEHLRVAAAMNVNNHLLKLQKEGRVVSQGELWCSSTRKSKV